MAVRGVVSAGLRTTVFPAASAAGSFIVCHSTLPHYLYPDVQPAICRGFADRYRTQALQLIERLFGFVEVDPPRRLVQTWRMVMDPELEAEGFTVFETEWWHFDAASGPEQPVVGYEVLCRQHHRRGLTAGRARAVSMIGEPLPFA